MKQLFFIIIICLWVIPVFSDDKDIIVIEGTSKLTNITKARGEIHENVITERTLRAIKDIVGPKEFAKNQKLILDKVMPKKDRFILFSKNSKPTTKNGLIHMFVTFKLSLPDLRTILTQEGLLKSQSGPITVLPLFIISDEVQDIFYGWWLPSEINEEADSKKLKFLKAQSLKLIRVLQKGFSTGQFLFIDPIKQKSLKLVSKNLQKTRYKRKELMRLGDQLKTQILLIGRLRFYRGQLKQDISQFQQNMLEIKLSAFDCTSGKVITKVKEQHPVLDLMSQDSDKQSGEMAKNSVGEDLTKQDSKTIYTSLNGFYTHVIGNLATQTLAAWQNGYFRLKHKKLILLGHLKFQQIESFKQTIREKMPSIKNIRERKFSRDQVVFEMESDMEQKPLAKQLSQIDFNELQLTNMKFSKDRISFRVN